MAYDRKEYVRRAREMVENNGHVADLLLRFHEEVDQKAASTLTFLGLLVAGMSFLAVALADTQFPEALRVMVYFGVGAVFVLAFTAALLCLTCFNMTGFEDVPDHSDEEILELLAQISISRRKRYVVALRCTVGAALLFAGIAVLYLAMALISG